MTTFWFEEHHLHNLWLIALALGVVASCSLAAEPGVADKQVEAVGAEQQALMDLVQKRVQALAAGKYEIAIDRQREIVTMLEVSLGANSTEVRNQKAWLTHFVRLAQLSDGRCAILS